MVSTFARKRKVVLSDYVQWLYDKAEFVPTAGQFPILACEDRFILVTGGEQGGKSFCSAAYLVKRWPEADDGGGLYWLVGARYENTMREFRYLADSFEKIGVLESATKRVDPGEIRLHDGTVIKTKSAQDPRSLMAEAPDGIIVCEAAQIDLDTYLRCSGRVGPKRGWLFLSGTLESGSMGWYPGLAESWKNGTMNHERSFELPSWSNNHLYPLGRQDPEILRIERDAPDEWFMERIAGKPSPPKGAVFANYFRPHIHVRDIEWDPAHPVRLWIDPGYDGAHAVEAVQVIGDVVYVIDEIYEKMGTESIIDIVRQRPWWDPGNMVPGVIDVYAYQHHAMDVTPAEIWAKETGMYFGSNKVRIMDGIDRFKSFLKPNPVTGEPKIFFAPHCRGVLSELGANPNPFDGQSRVYRWKMARDGTLVGTTPEDKYNHGIKALTYGIVDNFGVGFTGSGTIKVTRY